MGTYRDALASPNSAKYLCSASEEGDDECTHDHSAVGMCQTWESWDGFYSVLPVRLLRIPLRLDRFPCIRSAIANLLGHVRVL